MSEPSAAPSRDVTVETSDGVALVTLHRPPHNLLTVALLRALADGVEAAAGGGRRPSGGSDTAGGSPSPGDAARAIVLASEGRSFCAGANFRSDEAPDPTADGGSFAAQTSAFYEQAARLFDAPVPMVAAVQGAAIGAGFGLALACDLRVVGERGWFQANFVRLGIHPGFALSTTLPRLVGPGRSADLFLTGRRLGAEEAGSWGLADRVVPEGAEVGAALELAAEIAGGAPLAVGSTRATLRAGLAESARSAMRLELEEQAALAGTADAIEGVRAMLEGRSPRFEGR